MTIGKPFKKGQSGNPGGRPKVIAEVKELAREHTGAAIETLVSIMANPKAAPAARVSAANALLDRGYGKPGDVRLRDEERRQLQKFSRELIELKVNQLINRQPNANSMRRPTSVIGGKADMTRTGRCVR